MFSEHEIDFMSAAAPLIADGVRRGLLVGETTEPERPEVTQPVLRGGSTTERARALGVSPHTVQQHLKSIFEKTEVNSRGELVAKVYFDCFDLRARDNRDRIQAEQSVRGGPKTSGSASPFRQPPG